MRKVFLSIILLVLIVVFCSFRSKINFKKVLLELRANETEIEWSSDRKLVWDDFKGIPDVKSFPHSLAVTHSSIIIKSPKGVSFNSENIFVGAVFSVNDSWVLPEGLKDHLLSHEQIHFDITEIYARKVREYLKNVSFKGLKKEVLIIDLNKIKNEYENRQIEYDEATNHGTKKETQQEWEAIVKIELAKYDLYKAN